MKKYIIPYIILLGVLQSVVFAQVHQIGFNLLNTTFESTLESALELQVGPLEADPFDLDTVLQEVGDAIRDELRQVTESLIIMSALTFDATTVAEQFGFVVQVALATIVQLPGFERLDLESVGLQVEIEVIEILAELDLEADVDRVAGALGDAILGAIAEGILEVTGGEYTYQLSTSGAQTLSPQQELFLSILQELSEKNVDTAYEILKPNNASVIIAMLEIIIEQNLQEEASQLLIKFFEDDTVPIEKLGFTIALFMQSQDSFGVQTLVDSIKSTTNISSLVGTFAFELTQGEEAVAEAFIDLVYRSIVDGFCGVSNIISGVFASVSFEEVQDITLQLWEADAEACVVEAAELRNDLAPFPGPTTLDATLASTTPEEGIEPTLETNVSSVYNPTLTSTITPSIINQKQEDEPVAEEISMVETEPEEEAITISYIQGEWSGLIPTSEVVSKPRTLVIQAHKSPLILEPEADIDEEGPFLTISSFTLTISPLPEDGPTIESTDDLGEQESMPLAPLPISDSQDIVQDIINQPEFEIIETKVVMGPIVEKVEVTQVCEDVLVPGVFTCAQQKSFGKCNASWMLEGNFCAETCGRCCTDVSPNERYTCEQQKEWGKCNDQWMINGQYCQRTCGRCQS